MKNSNSLTWFGGDLNCFISEQEPLVLYDSVDGITWSAVEDKEKIASVYKKMGAVEERNKIRNIGFIKRVFNKLD